MPLGQVATWRQHAHFIPMTKRATHRPQTFEKPAYWSDDPVPTPEPVEPEAKRDDPQGLSPTRYGDWVKKGIAIDF